MNQKFIDIIGNRYGILKSIGRGEFGEVWLAIDTHKQVLLLFKGIDRGGNKVGHKGRIETSIKEAGIISN